MSSFKQTNQQIIDNLGFGVQAGGGRVDAFLNQNPHLVGQYESARQQYQPGYDFESTAGYQTPQQPALPDLGKQRPSQPTPQQQPAQPVYTPPTVTSTAPVTQSTGVSTPQKDYLATAQPQQAQPASQQASQQPVGQGDFTQQMNQAIVDRLGLGVQAGGGRVNEYLAQNPGDVLRYAQARTAVDPNYRFDVDVNPNIPGVQTIGPDVNRSIGAELGYYGDVGRGELGSGKRGIDYLTLLDNPQAAEQYTQLRQLVDPGFTYSPYDVAPEGFDEQRYLELNPDVASQVGAGQYITGLQHYLESGQAQGRQFQGQTQDEFLNELQALFESMFQPQIPDTLQSGYEQVTRPAAPQDLPSALAGLEEASDIQRRAAIATDALYGAGYQPNIQEYYMNTLLRGLINEQGEIGEFDIAPIERQYLSSLGLDTSSGEDFLDSLALARATNGLV